jgi:hypothetical protein
MNKNLGNVDRIIRFVVALIIAALYFANIISGTVAITLFAVAAILIVTSFVGFCPLYYLFHIKTIKN